MIENEAPHNYYLLPEVKVYCTAANLNDCSHN